MGLFEDLGERVERFKQEVTDAAEDEAEYECADCGELLYTDHDRCPDCDADAVAPRELDAGDSSEDGTAPTDEAATANGDSTPEDGGSASDEAGETCDPPGRGDREADSSDGRGASEPGEQDEREPEP